MAEAATDGDVHRLVDMEVQEVSLVDRAANKRRFLVVKRSKSMSDSGSGTSGDNTSETEGSGSDGNDGGDDADGGRAEAGDAAGALAIASDALEGLTRAVESLQDEGADATGSLGDVVRELRAAADRLQERLGADSEGGEDNTAADAGEQGHAARLDSLLSAVGALVSEIRTSRSTTKASTKESDDEEEPAAGGKPKSKTSKAAPAAAQTSSADMKEIRAGLKDITGMLQTHTRRLDRLEKRAGVPSSQPAGERPSRAAAGASEDVSWPLDLNSPRSR